jgi:pSer/pThr/pTyr-binding forkhead associated (FHA) protein
MDRKEWLVGRSDPVRGIFPEVDLSTYGGDQSGVSRRHARLISQKDQRFISDLNSTNFTFVNGEKLQPGQLYPLKNKDEIRFGLLVVDYFEEISE